MDEPDAPEPRTIEWFNPGAFARDYWHAKHAANRRRPNGREAVVLFGDSLTEQWTAPLPMWLFLGQELDTWVLEAPDGRKTNGARRPRGRGLSRSVAPLSALIR